MSFFLPKISTGEAEVPVSPFEYPIPRSPKKWIRSTEMPTRHTCSPPRPISPKKWISSTDVSARHSPPKYACKFPSTSPHWPAIMDAIQNDDPEKMLALLHDIKAGLNYENAQVIMNARTHLPVIK